MRGLGHGLVILALGLGVWGLSLTHSVAASIPRKLAWQFKVAPGVWQGLQQGQTEFLLLLNEQADLSAASALSTKSEKGLYVYEQLTHIAQRTQPPVVEALKRLGAAYRPYWVVNLIWVRGGAEVVQAMAQRADAAYLAANPRVRLQLPPQATLPAPQATAGVEWNLLKVQADKVWAEGYIGQGVVVAGQDTGYQWDHPALKNSYRGWDGLQADHNYNWHDAIHASSNNPCGNNALAPCDDHGHGTHTMGIMVGEESNHRIGMAPGARWIGCRNMDQGVGSPATYIECFQWFIAPTDLNGQNPRPNLAPDVINNSWGCPASEGCDLSAIQAMEQVVDNVRAAGILVVASAGNSGRQGCGSVNDPPAIYRAALSVGATTSTDTIAEFSSRGPADYTGLLKPDVSAPGVGVNSAWPLNAYQSLSGTSMAAPHVAGLGALLISVNPALRGQVDALENLIKRGATPHFGVTCGGVPGSDIPNNTYGWGRIDAWAARQLLIHRLSLQKIPSSTKVSPGQILTYTLQITNLSAFPTDNVVLSDTLPAHTTFITATLPHTFDGTTVYWEYPALAANATQSVQLVLGIGLNANGAIVNQYYGARSGQASGVVGAPLSVPVFRPYYFPLISR